MDLLEWNKEYKNEISVLQKLKHNSIVRLVDTEKRLDGRGVIYLEYLPYPTLSYYIHNTATLGETVAVKVLYGLVDAIHYLHTMGFSHHDIKPDNILFNCDNQSIKLFDFGLAVTVDPEYPISNSNAGSPLYMAPEILLNDTHNVYQSDTWSIGICLYEMLSGRSPFQYCETLEDLQKEWSAKKDISLSYFLCSSKLRMLYSRMVKYDPDKRISLTEEKKILSTLITKRCIGNSLGVSGGKRKPQRSSSVQTALRRIQPVPQATKSKKTKQKPLKKGSP